MEVRIIDWGGEEHYLIEIEDTDIQFIEEIEQEWGLIIK